MSKPPHKPPPEIEITVLVTAHNEADTIPACLRAIAEQDFPIERIEILVVDDRSTDATSRCALELGLPGLRVLRLDQPPAGLTARQAALDLGLREARGEVVLVTDAAGRVPREWIRELTGHLGYRDGAATGPVIFAGGHPFLARFQTIDTLVSLTLQRWAYRHRFATGLIGANMAVRREAYLETGGFPVIGFALAEDRALGRALCRAGWSIRYLTEPATLKPAEPSFSDYIVRARRRSQGAPPAVFWIALLALSSNLLLLALTLFGASPLWPLLLLLRYALGVLYIGVSVSQYAPASLVAWVPAYEPLTTLVVPCVSLANLVLRRWTWGGVVYKKPFARSQYPD